MTKKTMKQMFKNRGVKTNDGAITMIERHLEKQVDLMAQRCSNRNVKVLRIDNFEFAMPNPFKQ